MVNQNNEFFIFDIENNKLSDAVDYFVTAIMSTIFGNAIINFFA